MSAEVSSLVNLAGDLAGTYRWTLSSGDSVDPAVAEADLAMLRRDGYVILPDLLTADDLMEIREAVVPLLDLHGRNRFEGHTTQRVYSVLNKTRACDRIADHPRVLALLDRLFVYLTPIRHIMSVRILIIAADARSAAALCERVIAPYRVTGRAVQCWI
ncbi:Phytanoyl-CoA dioxygenase [Mycobacteroides abscessus subsp. bolletii]|nr:Phytanoyl-CoA dioxygenase [Mycobacteroides abscessus]SKF04678.1 Phytanoyl-CoA dioxygenase [Mycobacteroides abscessus subsp. bolletii]SKG31025.1 Phytanoyl-CoA dioxygenase [Mycobacteroides abscessus subsp. bolletii]